MDTLRMLQTARAIVVFFIFLSWAGVANALPVPVSVSLTSSASTALNAGDTFSVTVTLNDPITFDTLDALLSWDSVYVTPIDQVSADPFLTLGGLFSGTDFQAAGYSSIPGDSSLTISMFSGSLASATGPGNLFSLAFQVNSGVVLPASTLIEFGSLPSYPGNGLALTYLDWNTFDLTEYLASPNSLSIALANPGQPVPEPGVIELLVLSGLLSRRFVRFSVST